MQGRQVIACVSSVADASLLLEDSATVPSAGPAASERILNPADEAALQFARSLTGGDASVILAVHVGPPGDELCLREALAHGAAHALLLENSDAEMLGAQSVAEAIVDLCAASHPEWVVCGQATLDWGNGLVGPMIAGLLGWPLIDHVVEVRDDGGGVARCERVIGRGARDELVVTAPAIIAASPLAFQPAIAPLRDRLRAQRAAIQTRPAVCGGMLPRAARYGVARPRPRPKATLPADYSEWAPEERLAYLTQASPAARAEPTRWLRGDAAAAAAQILDYLESSGVHLPWAR